MPGKRCNSTMIVLFYTHCNCNMHTYLLLLLELKERVSKSNATMKNNTISSIHTHHHVMPTVFSIEIVHFNILFSTHSQSTRIGKAIAACIGNRFKKTTE